MNCPLLRGLLFTLIAACRQAAVPAEKAESVFASTEYNQFNSSIFELQYKQKGEKNFNRDTLALFTSPYLLPEQDYQFLMQWQFVQKAPAGSYQFQKSKWDNSITGIKIEDTLLYIHPPRHNYLKILQFAPHPLFQNPQRVGHSYVWDLTIGEGWAIDSLFSIKDKGLFYNVYKNLGEVFLDTKFGHLNCWQVLATGTSLFGISTASYYLNKDYGLVKFSIQMQNGSLYEFILIDKTIGIKSISYNTVFTDLQKRSGEKIKRIQWRYY